MERWVYSFKADTSRDLNGSEIVDCRARAKSAKMKAILQAIGSVMIFLVAILGIMFAASGFYWGWAILVGFSIFFFKVLSMASNFDRSALFWRRCVRLGKITRFERSVTPPEVKTAFTGSAFEEEGLSRTWWDQEEKFEERIAKLIGRQPDWIELLGEDDVLYSVEGTAVEQPYDLIVIRL